MHGDNHNIGFVPGLVGDDNRFGRVCLLHAFYRWRCEAKGLGRSPTYGVVGHRHVGRAC